MVSKIFSSKKFTVSEMKEKFNNHCIKNNITISDLTKYELANIFINAAKNKDITGLKAINDIGFPFKMLSFSDVQDAIMEAAKHKNFREYFSLMNKMGTFNNIDYDKEYENFNAFCVISYLLNKNKKEIAEALIQAGFSKKIQSSTTNNIFSYLIEDRKYGEAINLLKEMDILLKGETISWSLFFAHIDNKQEKNNYIDFIKEIINSDKVEKSGKLLSALWMSVCLNKMIKVSDVKDILPPLPYSEENQFKLDFLHLKNANAICTLNSSLHHDYPDKLNLFKEYVSESIYENILKNFSKHVISHPKKEIVDDLAQKTDFIKLLENEKELVVENVESGNMSSFALYNHYFPDNQIITRTMNKFVEKNVFLHGMKSNTLNDLCDYFVTSESVNEISGVYVMSNYKRYSLFNIALENNYTKMLNKMMNMDNFDIGENIKNHIEICIEENPNKEPEEIMKNISEHINNLVQLKSFRKLKYSDSMRKLNGVFGELGNYLNNHSYLIKETITLLNQLMANIERVELSKTIKENKTSVLAHPSVRKRI